MSADSEKPKDLQIIIAPELQAQLDADPELAEAMRELFASFRQAHHAVETGTHKSFDEAMEAITGHRPEIVDLTDANDDDE